MRTPALATELGIGEAAVDALLEPARASGALTTCDVETGGRRIIEYRCSASGGKYDLLAARATAAGKKPPQHIEPTAAQVPAKATSGCDAEADSRKVEPATSARAAPAPAVANQGDQEVTTLVDKILAALKKHGPMTTRELRAHVDHPNMPTYCGQLADRGTLGRLGGGKRSTIYGLPDQKAPEKAEAAEVDKAPRAIHRKKKQAKKRAGGGAVAMRRKPSLKGAKKARSNGQFRPALASDGAILFIGAHRGEFEIPRAEARVVVSLVRRLTGDELVKAVDFIERLDGAEVGA
jgi:hypothetical protein